MLDLFSRFLVNITNDPKPRLRDISSGVQRPVNIPFSRANKTAPDRKILLACFPVSQKQIFLANRAFRELFRKRAIGPLSLRENNYAGGFFIQAMDNRQRCPARLAVPQPLVQTLGPIRGWSMRVDPWRFVHHQQVVILKNHSRQHSEIEPTNQPIVDVSDRLRFAVALCRELVRL